MSLLLDALNKGRSADSVGGAERDSKSHFALLDADLELSPTPEIASPLDQPPNRQEITAADRVVDFSPPVVPPSSAAPQPGGGALHEATQSASVETQVTPGAMANARQAQRWWQKRFGASANPDRLRWRALAGVLALAAVGVAFGLWWLAPSGAWLVGLADLTGLVQTPPAQTPPVVVAPSGSDPGMASGEKFSPNPAVENPASLLQPPSSPAPTQEATRTPAAQAVSVPQGSSSNPAAPVSARSRRPGSEMTGTTRPPADRPRPPTQPTVATEPQLRVERDPLDILREQADAAVLASRWEDAQRAYEAWLERQPDDPAALAGLALVLHRQHRWAQAWQAYQRAVQRWPENPALRSGALAVLTQLDPMLAESRLRDWVADNPGDALAHAALGTLLARQQRWAMALEPMQQAVRLAPGEAIYHYNLALVLERLNRHELALQHYRHSLALGDAALPLTHIERNIRKLQQKLMQGQDTDEASAGQ